MGTIWWFEDRDGREPRAFVYHVLVEQHLRRRCYGSAALQAVSAQARSMGMAAVGLHVLAHDPDAIRIYERLGFRRESLIMLKPLNPQGRLRGEAEGALPWDSSVLLWADRA